jgi:uncharacterized protein
MKRYKLISFMVVLFLVPVCNLHAQLPRRASLGTHLQNVNDSIASLHNMTAPAGVMVSIVVEGSSADHMGLRAHDIILSVNGNETNTPSQLVNLIGAHKGGDQIRIELMRDGEKRQIDGELQPLPFESSPFAEIIYDVVPVKDGNTRIIINKPKQEGVYPAVFFIQGLGCFSMERLGNNAYQKILDGLVQQGYVFIRTEKAGAGDSQTERDCSEYSLLDEVALFSASYNSLQKYDFIDHDNIFVFGHSMGGVQAPMMDFEFDPRGIAVYGTVIRPWFEYFIDLAWMQQIAMGGDYLEIERQAETRIRFYSLLMLEKQTPEQIAEDDELLTFMLQNWGYDGEEKLLGRHYTFWHQLQDTKLFSKWANTPAYVLSLWGEGEFVAVNPWEHELIAEVVNRYNPGKARFMRVPNMDHGFIKVDDLKHAVSIRNNSEYIAENFNENIIAILNEWMNEMME